MDIEEKKLKSFLKKYKIKSDIMSIPLDEEHNNDKNTMYLLDMIKVKDLNDFYKFVDDMKTYENIVYVNILKKLAKNKLIDKEYVEYEEEEDNSNYFVHNKYVDLFDKHFT